MKRSVAWIIRLITIAGAIFALDRWCVAPFECNRGIAVIKRSTEQASKTESAHAIVTARDNIERLRRMTRACDRSDLYVLLAMNESVVGRTADALRSIDEALARDQRPELYYDRGLIELSLGQTDTAVSDIAIAVRFNRSFLFGVTGELQDRVRKAADASDRMMIGLE